MSKPNRLAAEQSPYLRQHAHNPVDWYPWGEEALERARHENRPILLSIGYSACHWCHVMERESFENPEIAALMNEGFVNVKVDREERPDLDAIYMNVVQMLTGSGGWPLTVFLTPDGKPFYGGTYFPPEDRYGRPGFPRVLRAVLDAYREKPDELARTRDQILAGLARLSRFAADESALSPQTRSAAAEKLLAVVDLEHGGIGGAPKFPNVPAFALFLREHYRTGRDDMLDAFVRTLDGMAHGGIYDQLGGGFHRYSVDAQWLVPHFEKMLYDNAQLAALYVDGFAATGRPLYRRVAEETLRYLLREMAHPAGGFYSSQDADTSGEEGRTYLWTLDEIHELLEEKEAQVVARWYQVDEAGNFAEPGHTERKSILHVKLSLDELARMFSETPEEIERALQAARAKLLDARMKRPQPARDEKILTSWNALAIRAFVRAARVLGEAGFLETALRTADFLHRHLRDPHGRLLRTYKDGIARYPAYLDDHACLAVAHLDLFEATGEARHLERARELADVLIADFLDSDAGGFFFTSRRHEALIDRPKIPFDGSMPSGNALAAELFSRLGRLLDEDRYRKIAHDTLALFGAPLQSQPFGLASLIAVLDDHLGGAREVVVVGARDDSRTTALVRAASSVYAPGQSVLLADPADSARLVPAPLREKVAPREGPVAYVCESFTCSPPVSDPEELRGILARRPKL